MQEYHHPVPTPYTVTTAEPEIDTAEVHFEFKLSEGVSDYFQGFVDALNEFQYKADFVSDPTGQTTPQVNLLVQKPTTSTGFWPILFEDVVNGNDQLFLDVIISVYHGEEVLYDTSMENLAIILANPITNAGDLQFILFENSDEEECCEEDDCECEEVFGG